jgi:hypothetical protein
MDPGNSAERRNGDHSGKGPTSDGDRREPAAPRRHSTPLDPEQSKDETDCFPKGQRARALAVGEPIAQNCRDAIVGRGQQ